MGSKRFRRTVTTLLFILLLFANIPAKILGERSKNIDIIVVMDNSGSMAYNDRSNLRFDVVKSFIDRLHIGDSIGVLHFNTDVDVQLPITEIMGNEDKALLKDKIETVWPRKDTDVLLALATALENIRARESSQNTKYCILVTDGEIDPGPEFRRDEEVRERYYRDLGLLVDQYEDNIWPIFVVFLSPGGREDDFLKEIARRTGGNFYHLKNVNELEDIFSEIFHRIDAIKDEVGRAVEARKAAKELIPDIGMEIISPGSEKYYRGERMNIEAQLSHDSRRLAWDQSLSIESFKVEVSNKGENSLISQELNDSGNLGDIRAGDGIYSTSFIPKVEGNFEFRFRAEGAYGGRPFIAEDSIEIEVLAPSTISMKVDFATQGAIEVMQGRGLRLNLDFESDADSRQILELSWSLQSKTSQEPIKIAVFPEDTGIEVVEIPIPRTVSVGKQSLILSARTLGQGVLVEPGELVLDIQIVPYNFFKANKTIIYLVSGVLGAGLLLYGYLSFIRFRKKKAWTIKGKIICYKDEKRIKRINLGKIGKQRVKISTVKEMEPDILIPLESPLTFEIFMESGALTAVPGLRGSYRPKYFVIGDYWDEPRELKDGDSFMAGGYIFTYRHRRGKTSVNPGRDVLKDYGTKY